MFDLVLESMRKATESTIQMQQEMFRKWTGMWPGFPSFQPAGPEQVLQFQKKWAEVMEELARKQRETLEAQFKTGLKNIEDSFRLAQAKDFEELRTKSIELWQKTFDCLRQSYEAQVRDFQTAVTRMAELMMRGTS